MTATITEHPTQTVETATTAQATATNTQAEANRLTFAELPQRHRNPARHHPHRHIRGEL